MMAIWANVAFLILAVGLAVNVGYFLWRHGAGLGAASAGRGRPEGSIRSFTGLTVLGYGLVAVGAAVLLLLVGDLPETVLELAVFVGIRLGVFLIFIGVTHFKCLTVLSRVAGAGADSAKRQEPVRLRHAKEDPLDRVFEAARLNAPSGL